MTARTDDRDARIITSARTFVRALNRELAGTRKHAVKVYRRLERTASYRAALAREDLRDKSTAWDLAGTMTLIEDAIDDLSLVLRPARKARATQRRRVKRR